MQKKLIGVSVVNKGKGFTLIELMIVVVIITILGAIAIPAYNNSITKTRRRAAQTCLANFANYMERFYTTNLRYDQDTGGTAVALPNLACATENSMDEYYAFSLSAVAQATYDLQAVPQGGQVNADSGCGTQTLDETGAKGVSGSDGVDACW